MRHLSVFAVLALAAATPLTSEAPNFRLIASDIDCESPLSVANGWSLSSYHIIPCYDYSVFSEYPGRIFYANGTAGEFSAHTSNILSDGGRPAVPWGLKISSTDALDELGRRNVFTGCGEGSPGVYVSNNSSTLSYGTGTGTFYVCNSTLLFGPAITLYYREPEDYTAPEECSNVTLKAWCLDQEEEHLFGGNVTCLDST